MSSVNLYPTFHYSQPAEYHFSHDSVFMARRVFEFIQSHQLNLETAVDLCAGCGVIGLDLLFHMRAAGLPLPLSFDFIEVQAPYKKHFEQNLISLGLVATDCRFLNKNFVDDQIKTDETLIAVEKKYDLIVCNPPYFFKDEGKWPTSELKRRSRFNIDSDFTMLIQFIVKKLSANGIAFLLVRSRLDHSKDQRRQLDELCKGHLKTEWMDDIRGTHLVRLAQEPRPIALPD